jgi:uncharacterized oxidoreductase
MELAGNTILITGGTSGIGLAFAEAFYKAGSTVIICGRRTDRLENIARNMPGIITYRSDVSDEKQRLQLCNRVLADHPETNMLMNNAGIQLPADLTRPVDLALVREEVETNLIAPIHLGSLFAAHLATRPNAALINITSGLAFVPIAFMPVYCATKAALHSVTLSWRHQMRGTGVRVFEIAPPSTDTELGHQRRTDKTQSHGGMPIDSFIREAMEAIAADKLEAPIAQAIGLRAKGEELFSVLNPVS